MFNKHFFDQEALSDFRSPEYYSPFFEWMYDDSIKILSSRSEQEISQLVKDIDRAIATSTELENFITNKENSIFDLADLYDDRIRILTLLRHAAKDKEPSDLSSVRGVTMEELFAAALLSHVLYASCIQKEYDKKSDLSSLLIECEESFIETMGHYAICGMEILSLLRVMPGMKGLLDFKSLIPDLQNNKKNKRKAANIRHSPGNLIKETFITWYLANKEKMHFKSKIGAAERYFYEVMTDKEKSIISSPRTLEKALTKYISKI